MSGRHGWLNEVNGGTGGSPDNLNSLIILTVGILVAIITYIRVLHIQFTESKILHALARIAKHSGDEDEQEQA